MKKIFIVLLIAGIGFGIYSYLGTRSPAVNSNLEAFVNTDLESDVAIVVKATNGESLVGFVDEGRALNKVVLTDADGQSALISVDERGYPSKLEFEGTVATFNNYTENTVDITVRTPDGEVKVYEGSAITGESLSFIPRALAYSVSDYITFLSITLNVVTCGAGIGATVTTIGTFSGLSVLGCAQLTARVVTRDMVIGSCDKDYLECAAGALRDAIQKDGPAFLKDGFRLKGGVNNTITGSPITDGVILVDDLSIGTKSRGEWTPDSYEIYFKDSGVYSARFVSQGFADLEFNIILTPTKAQIRLPGHKLDLEEDLGGKDYSEIETQLFMNPDAFISGEIIDAIEGDTVKGARVSLLDGSTVVDTLSAGDDGMFNVQPTLSPVGKNFVLRVSADGYEQKDVPLFISYEVKQDSSEYEIDNWNGVVKLEKGGDTDLTGVWDGQLVVERKELRGNNMFICDQSKFVFKIIKKVDGGLMLNGSLGKSAASTAEKDIGSGDSFYWDIDENGMTTFRSGSFRAEGKLSGSSGGGTWTQTMKDWSTPAHEEFEICSGTWTAEKVK
jgi:hypothetical protein